MCQANGYADCQTRIQGGCQAQCQQPSGALFCNGNYIDVSDLQQCEADLAATFNIHATATGNCSSNANGSSCQGKASVSCGQIAPGSVPPVSPLLLGVGVIAAAAGVVRRRRAKR
jgi:MYXO-CTERM domain-containing protein